VNRFKPDVDADPDRDQPVVEVAAPTARRIVVISVTRSAFLMPPSESRFRPNVSVKGIVVDELLPLSPESKFNAARATQEVMLPCGDTGAD
jgi:hypothetical protein